MGGVRDEGAPVAGDGFGAVGVEAGAGGEDVAEVEDGEEAEEGFEMGELDEEAGEDGGVFEFVDVGVFLGVGLLVWLCGG